MPALATATDPVTVANRLRPVLLKLNRHLRREIHSLGVTGGEAPRLLPTHGRAGRGPPAGRPPRLAGRRASAPLRQVEAHRLARSPTERPVRRRAPGRRR